MRLRNLKLQRYGWFEAHELDLPQGAGLLVVYGPNAAGKSTFLAAVSDFLFGIPDRTLHGQRFGYDQMRITGTIETASGKKYVLRRHKARGPRALTDEQGAPVDETVLAGLLGGVGRQKFGALFGLDHASLRVGGENLLAADGDIGRLIVEAGGGLRSLVSRLAELEKEATDLFSSRRAADRAFYKAVDAFSSADKDVKEGSVSFEAYREAKENLEVRGEALETVRRDLHQMREATFALQRLLRVAPVIAELDECTNRLTEFADILHIDPEMPSRIDGARTKYEAAEAELYAAQHEVERLSRERDAIVFDKRFLLHAETITSIGIKAIHVAREHEHRAKREGELQNSILKLQALKRTVGIDDIATLQGMAPDMIEIDRVQELATESTTDEKQLETTLEQVEEITSDIALAIQDQLDRKKRGLDQPLLVKESEFALIASHDADVRRLNADLALRTSKVTTLAAADGFKDADEARGVLWPVVATIDAEKRRREDLEKAIDIEIAAKTEVEGHLKRAKRSLERTTRQGELPTPAAIDSARSVRDGSWERLRDLVLDEKQERWVVVDLGARQTEVSAFEKAKSWADNLSDRKGEEADRVADARRAEQDVEEYTAKGVEIDDRIKSLTDQLKAVHKAWSATWPLSSERLADLDVLRQLVERRDALITAADDLFERQERLAVLAKDLDAAKSALVVAEERLGLSDRHKVTLKRRLEDVSAAITAHAEGHHEFGATAALLTKLQSQLRQREAQRDALELARANRKDEWRALMPKLGLPVDARAQLALQTATLWTAADGVFGEIAITKRRLEAMKEDDDDLRSSVALVARDLGLDLGPDPVSAADILVKGRKGTESSEQERAALLKQLRAAESAVERKQAELQQADAEIEKICKALQCARPELATIGQRRGLATIIQVELMQFTQQVRAAADGHPIETLREAIQSRSIDALKSDEAEAEAQREQLELQREEAVRALQEAEKAFGAVSSAEALGTAIADREAAAADLEAVASRYVQIRVAKSLLEAAIERVRSQQQNPLVARAAALFSACTRGAFTGIEADVDDKGVPIIVGRRKDGEIVRVGVMSDGERDQLYLSFRLAAIEHYGEAAEALPFIADDVLVHFDDPRSSASLDVLATFAENSQVILFTHHNSVLEAATMLEAEGRAAVVRLA